MLVGAAVVRAVLVAAAVQSVQSPAAPAPSALILGRVVDAASGRPVAAAIVSLSGGGTGTPRAMTNPNGQFVFRKLPKGRFTLLATKPGYVEGAYGRRRPGGTSRSVELDEGQRAGDITIMVWRRAAIAGTVSDEAGEPVIGVNLNLYVRRYTAGHRRFLPAGTTSTDDRGMYRFGELIPGDYIVAFVSRQVTVPLDVNDVPPAPTDPKAQEINRQRISLGGGLSSSPGSPDALQDGTVVRLVDLSLPPPPAGSDAKAPIFIYPTLFFPNSPSAARAGIVTVQSGQERDGVDLSLHPVRASRVTGSVIGPDGAAANIAVHVSPAGDPEMTDIEAAGAMTDADGNFTVAAIPVGQYIIKASRIPRPSAAPTSNMVTTQILVGGSMMGMSSATTGTTPPPPPPIPDDPGYYADTTLAVADTNVDNVIVALQRGARISGRFEFEGSADRPDASAMVRIPVILERADNSIALGLPGLTTPPAGHADENGAFKTYSQAPGRYLVRVGGAPSGWTVKSVTAEGRDISEAPFDLGTSDIGNVVITFTDRPTKLTGTARTKDGNPDTDALVVVFPADPAGWSDFGLNPRRIRSARPMSDGTFTFNGLPAGDYYVTAISEEATGSWQEPQALAELARSATQVRLADGDTRTQDIVRSGRDK